MQGASVMRKCPKCGRDLIQVLLGNKMYQRKQELKAMGAKTR